MVRTRIEHNAQGNQKDWVFQESGWYLLHKNIVLHDMLVEMESLLNGGAGAVDLIKEIQVIGFNPVDKNVVILL